MMRASPFSPLIGMTMSSQVPRLWEVWHARFNFDRGKGYKYRPVIIVGIRENGSLVMMVTSSTNILTLEHDYLLQDWAEAGLERPSIARADRIAEIPLDYIGHAGKIGRLSIRDEMAIRALLTRMAESHDA